MVEYASRRFRLSCCSATRDAIKIVPAAIHNNQLEAPFSRTRSNPNT